jgi:uncharacterized membrane protein
MSLNLRRFAVESDSRNETLRTNLWLIPVLQTLAAIGLFVVTLSIDYAAFHHEISLPSWFISGSPDAAREILSSLSAAIITVVGVVFSIMMVVLTLASTQFGPRMTRTFIRDRGTRAHRHRSRHPHLLHPPHRDRDPAARGHRQHRQRPRGGD